MSIVFVKLPTDQIASTCPEQFVLFGGHESCAFQIRSIRTTAHLLCNRNRLAVLKAAQHARRSPHTRPTFAVRNRISCEYGEARGAESRADFIHKLKVVFKELNETTIWLEI